MKRALLGVGLLAAVLATGCEPPSLIDQTRPDYIRKSDLTSGTWYIRETVVDVPPTSSLSFIGYQGKMEKVRFEVQEDQLVAFRTYEEIPGTDPLVDLEKSSIGRTVTVDGKPYRGSPVAAWKIKSHFDRQRTYNPATGEQSNTLVEDTQDRPWYQREFMRVDWDAQIVRNYENVAGWGAEDRPTQALQPHVSVLDSEDGDDQFTMDFQEVGGAQQLAYMDFTNRQFWSPKSINYPGYGMIPYCLFDPTEDCSGQVMRVRTSVMRVDEAAMLDYEPLRYDDKAMVKFGYFRTERITYDRNRGIPESGRILWANRHNIWEKSHDAEGQAIPLDQRSPKPIVYHLSLQFPADILPAARELEAEWDRAFRRAVAVPRGTTEDNVPQMFVVCENPVPAGAHPACGAEGTSARLGDLRYNFLAWVDQVQKTGPLGYGPSSADPETGEIISGSAYQYGAGMDSWAGDAQTIVEVLTGMRTVDELVSGKLSRDFVMADLSPTDARRPSQGPWSSEQGLTDDGTSNSPFARVKGDLKANLDKFRADNGLPVLREDRRRVVAELIAKNPALESSLIEVPEVRAMVMSLAPGSEWRARLSSDPQLYRSMARQTILRMDEFKALFDQRADWASRNNIWLAEFSDDAFYGLAKSMKAKFENRVAVLMAEGKSEAEAKKVAGKDMNLELRRAAFASIAEHEVGHTVGLRHNFQGSFDALNYQEGYWDLRKDTIGVMAGGKRVFPIRPADLKAAAEMNQAQLEGGMRELQYSSIMDYGPRMNAQVHGLGKYDEAAILFGYAGGKDLGWVEVFAEHRQDMANPHTMVETTNLAQPIRVRGAQTQIPFAHVTHYTPYNDFHSDRFHYTTLPFQFADKGLPFEQALDQGIERMQKRSFRPWSQMKGYYEAMEAEYKRLNIGDVAAIIPDSELSRRVVATVAPGGMPVEVPYMFCTDSEVFANVSCNRWDQGADIYEMSSNWLSQYEDYYAFSNFRRDRYFFGVSNVFNRVYGRLLGNLPNLYHNWLFNIYWYHYYYSLNPVELEEQLRVGDPIYQAYFTMAVFDGVNTLTGTLSNVAPGYYGKVPASGTEPASWKRLAENLPDASRLSDAEEASLRSRVVGGTNPYADLVYLPRGKGVRSPYTLYDTTGYDFYQRVNEVGHFWDQYAALNALSNSTTNFLGVDSGSDALRYSLPYYMTFDKELSRLYSGVWMENQDVFAPELVKVSEGLATVKRPSQINASKYIAGFVYPPADPVALDGSGAPIVGEKVLAKPQWGTRYYTQLYGMAFFTENYNQDFAAQNMVYVLGSGESVEPIPGYSIVTFNDFTGGGYTYAALVRDGATSQPAAPTMVLRAQSLATQMEAETDPVSKAAFQNELREVTRNLEIMRGLYQVFGRTL